MARPLTACLKNVHTIARPATPRKQARSTRLLLPRGISRLATAGSEPGTSRRYFATGIALTRLCVQLVAYLPRFLMRGR